MSQREQALQMMLNDRIVAVVREKNPDDVPPIVEVLRACGITGIEITLTTPGALELIEHLAAEEGLLIGAGSLMDAGQGEEVFAAGARFYASPCLDPMLIAAAHEADCVAMPGGLTPNELYTAWTTGADLLKIFPMPENGQAYIRSLLGPLPHLLLAPSGGITDVTGPKLLEAGASILNVGSWLTPDVGSLPERLEEIGRRGTRLRESLQRGVKCE